MYKGSPIFSSALCYCTAELLLSRGRPSSVGRPSARRPSSVKPVFSEAVMQINAKFGGKVPFLLISRRFFCFSKFCIFDFLRIFFIFVNMGPNMRKTSNDTSSENTYPIHSQKFMHTSREGLYQSCIKIGEISNFGFLPNFFRFR